MYTFLCHRITEAERRALTLYLRTINLYPFQIVIFTDDMEATVSSDKLILCYEKTKTKNKFDIWLESNYGDNLSNILKLDRPQNFLSSLEGQQNVAQLLKNYLKPTEYREIISSIIPESIPDELMNLILSNKSTIYRLKLSNEKILEIRPDHVNSIENMSLTISEFCLLVISKTLFKWEKAELI